MNRKKISILLLIIVLSCSTALAQQQEKKSSPGMGEWLKGLQKKMSQIVPKKVIPISTGVAGVRGAKEDQQVKLYWKGKKGEEAVTEEELLEFKKGLELAEKGDRAGAIKELEQFFKQFPDSALIPDAKKTLDIVKAEEKQAAVPAN